MKKRLSEREHDLGGMEHKRRHSTDDRTMIKDFLSMHTCYDLLPISSQVIVFDVSLPIKKAFYAMLQNGQSSLASFLLSSFLERLFLCDTEIRSAPLWDSEREYVVGMLTVTDFINILRFETLETFLISFDLVLQSLLLPGITTTTHPSAKQTSSWMITKFRLGRVFCLTFSYFIIILFWLLHPFFFFLLASARAEFEGKKPLSNKIVCSLDPMGNTYEAAKLLIQNKIHRIPLIERAKDSTELAVLKESVTGVITQFKILRFLSTNVTGS